MRNQKTKESYNYEVSYWKYLGLSLPTIALFVIVILSFTSFSHWISYFAFAVIGVFFFFSVAWWWWALDRILSICGMLDDANEEIQNLRKEIRQSRRKGLNGARRH